MAMLDYIVDVRRCERREVAYYPNYHIQQFTAHQFVLKHLHIFGNPEKLASLRFYMRMSMKLKLAKKDEFTREAIGDHPMWKVCH